MFGDYARLFLVKLLIARSSELHLRYRSSRPAASNVSLRYNGSLSGISSICTRTRGHVVHHIQCAMSNHGILTCLRTRCNARFRVREKFDITDEMRAPDSLSLRWLLSFRAKRARHDNVNYENEEERENQFSKVSSNSPLLFARARDAFRARPNFVRYRGINFHSRIRYSIRCSEKEWRFLYIG